MHRAILHRGGPTPIAHQVVRRRGGSPLVAGTGQGRDAVLLVRYPSRTAFARVVADPEYQQVTALRTAALAGAVLQPTRPWGPAGARGGA